MLGNEDDAKDLLQDVFVDVFLKLERLKEINTFSAWIKRITVNKCINSIKKKRVLAVSIEDEMDFAYDESDGDYIVSYETANIMQAIDQISDGCRTVLNLYLFEGYDHKEIGQILAITESASKSQYSKAKSKVRRILAADKNYDYGK
jgi:RNA polymerase sigma-70 factor (ECF subfamily)